MILSPLEGKQSARPLELQSRSRLESSQHPQCGPNFLCPLSHAISPKLPACRGRIIILAIPTPSSSHSRRRWALCEPERAHDLTCLRVLKGIGDRLPGDHRQFILHHAM